ncbi:alanine--tRNA ligase-related protein [Alicyclobacillus sp. SO9]|uniref:alanyl-tRNA editing protein n=1 Tax=Alicyclobacillus sp. SO9 TaxID=2665646 RepID=UPI0018E75603|nr:alanine--tRNA ligase-related protein [Alicyclobacillus sp. SO9]QQE81047.1 hypothetical protein GI364_12090 [Alicyclobacillus sp. SO9]
MTIQSQRLYYDKSYLMSFEATIEGLATSDSRLEVELDKTAFYPTSGGQPHDNGYINGIPVSDVYVNDNGQVIHRLSWDTQLTDPPLKLGQTVSGEIEWERRFYHMQHHTGQHILSACFEQILEAQTIGFHLGSDDVTIDIDNSSIDTTDIDIIENKANEIIMNNLPVVARFIENNELSLFQLRKPPKVSTDIRIVSIGDFDNNACGGTHVKSTAEVGLLKILKTERMRKGLRVHFSCGYSAFQRYQQEHRILSSLGNALSAGFDDLHGTLKSLQQELKTTKKNEKFFRREAAQHLGREAAGNATSCPSGLVYSVYHVDGPYGPGDAKGIALAALTTLQHADVSENPSGHAVGVIAYDGQKLSLAVVSSPNSTVNCNVVLDRVLEDYRGKGGGNQASAQGSIQNLPRAQVDEVTTKFETVLSQC